jgi:hypothetical protein
VYLTSDEAGDLVDDISRLFEMAKADNTDAPTLDRVWDKLTAVFGERAGTRA